MKDNNEVILVQKQRLRDIRHTLKNHLSVILAFNQLIQVEIEKNHIVTDQLKEYAQKVEQRAKKMVSEIDDQLNEQLAN